MAWLGATDAVVVAVVVAIVFEVHDCSLTITKKLWEERD